MIQRVKRYHYFTAITMIALLLLAGATLSLGATVLADRENRMVAGARMLDAFADYRAFCVGCHGETGQGVGGIIDFTSPAALTKLTRDGMIAAITAHDPSVATAWHGALNSERSKAVIDYIRDAFMLPAPDADASAGRRIFARACSVCHGERGDAASWAKNSLDPPPYDFTSEKAKALSRQHMIHTVSYGSPGTAMMPFTTQFSREEIIATVDYIRRSFMQMDEIQLAAAGGGMGHDHDHGTMIDRAANAPFTDGLEGDYGNGKALYKQNCADCHGLDGRGDGRRAYFMRRKPRDLASPETRVDFNRPHLFISIAKGVIRTEMPAWSKVLEAQQIADVAEYVFVRFVDGGDGEGRALDTKAVGKAGHAGHEHSHAEHSHDHDTGAKKKH
jgi:mono/diheme cytochrome c family protein